MKFYSVEYKVMDKYNNEFFEINRMTVEAESAEVARGKVVGAVYAITDFTFPRVKVLSVQ